MCAVGVCKGGVCVGGGARERIRGLESKGEGAEEVDVVRAARGKRILVQRGARPKPQPARPPAHPAPRRHPQADRFVKSGRALRRKMWWNNCKMKVVMAGVVVMVLFILVLLICFSAGGERRPAAARRRPR